MLTKSLFATSVLAACAAAAPRPQEGYTQDADVAGYTNADASFSVTFEPAATPASVFGPDSQIPVRVSCIN